MAALPLRSGDSLTVRVRTNGGSDSGAHPAAQPAAPAAPSDAATAAPAAASDVAAAADSQSLGLPSAAAAPSAPAVISGNAAAAALSNLSSGAALSGGASAPLGPPPVLPQPTASQHSSAAGAGVDVLPLLLWLCSLQCSNVRAQCSGRSIAMSLPSQSEGEGKAGMGNRQEERKTRRKAARPMQGR